MIGFARPDPDDEAFRRFVQETERRADVRAYLAAWLTTLLGFALGLLTGWLAWS